MVNSVAVGDRYVQPATLPYVCAAAPVVSALGLPWGLSLSILGVVLAAVGGWMLERETGGSGSWSFSLVGVVGPIAFYGTDTWEHAPAAGAAVLGTALLLAARSRWTGALGGMLWGLGVAMRSEMAIVAGALVVGVLVVAEVRRQVLEGKVRVAMFAIAGAGVLGLDRLAQDRLIGSDYRGGRVSSQAADVGVDVADRASDALVTTVGLFATSPPQQGILIGAALVLCLGVLGARVSGVGGSPTLVAVGSTGVMTLLAIRIVDPGFVPGLLAAAPVAVVGLFALRTSAPPLLRSIAAGAAIALPITWALQWRGNLGPQWGGRYTLVSAALLTVCGVGVMAPRKRTVASGVVLAAAVLVGASGLVWHVERTRTFAQGIEDVLALPCDQVLISTSTYLLREGGSFPEMRTGVRDDGCRMLNGGDGRLQLAMEVAGASGADTVRILAEGHVDYDPESLATATITGRQFIRVAGAEHTLLAVTLPEAT